MPGDVPSGWRREPLGSLGQFVKCRGGSKKDEVPTGVPVVRYGQLYTQYETVIREFFSFVSPDRANDYTPLKHGDVLFAGSGETLEEIGKAAVFLGDVAAHGSGDLILLRPAAAVDPLFLGYCANGGEANAQKLRLGQGSSVFHISADRLAGLRVALPPLPEQKKIAAVLSSVDEAIQDPWPAGAHAFQADGDRGDPGVVGRAPLVERGVGLLIWIHEPDAHLVQRTLDGDSHQYRRWTD